MTSAAASLWLTAAEIAELGLPGLPAEVRRVRELAKAQGWAERVADDGSRLARERRARGGGLEFHIALLPEPAQLRLRARIRAQATSQVSDTGQDNGHADAWARFETLPAGVQAKARQRMEILAQIEAMIANGSRKTAAVNAVAKAHGIAPRAIADWYKPLSGIERRDWLPFLAPNYKGGRQQEDIDPQVLQFIESDYLRPEKPAFASSYRRLKAWAKERGLKVPKAKTLKNRIDREVKPTVQSLLREGREANRRSSPPQKRSVAELHAMYAVNADGHTVDVRIDWGKGKIGRAVLVGFQDIYSRKILSHRIDRTESTESIRLAFADLLRNFGTPEIVEMDNGRAFASKALTGGVKNRYRFKVKDTDPTGMMTGLGVKVHWAKPYHGQSKPIERAWRDLCEDMAKHPAVAGAYTGNSPINKPDNYGERAIPIAEFREHVAACIAEHNARTGRETEIANGRSFDEAFNESYARSGIKPALPEQVRMALLEAEERPCHRHDGSVSLFQNVYWCEELRQLKGEKVSVRFDPDNLHSDVHIYRNGKYFCTAQVHEAVGFFDKASAKERSKQEADLLRKDRAAAEARNLLEAGDLANLLRTDTPTPPLPKPGATKIGHYDQTAGDLKRRRKAAPAPENTDYFEKFQRGVDRLKLVG